MNQKKRPVRNIICMGNSLLFTVSVNSYWLIRAKNSPGLAILAVLLFLCVNVMPVPPDREIRNFHLRLLRHGTSCLTEFYWSGLLSVLFHIAASLWLLPERWPVWAVSALLSFCGHQLLFWNGMISVVLSSVQLGIRHRISAVIFGAIPVLQWFQLRKIIRTVSEEAAWEEERERRNMTRKERAVCRTVYPVLLVHGVFFRDYKFPNYWGRIPGELKRNGARIYYGEHQSASSVAGSAAELAERIKKITEETGCGKVNIIAHSKGGLDCRYALRHCGVAPFVASVTTINTPHRGCGFADYLLEKIPEKMQKKVASAYESALKKLGDENPDFMAAVWDLTASACRRMEEEPESHDGIFCQSVGSRLDHASGGTFPLNFTYSLVNYFDGANDGLVSEDSFRWGEKYIFLTASGERGISHGDVIDLNRENIPGFDVREFYVNLVEDLRKRGL